MGRFFQKRQARKKAGCCGGIGGLIEAGQAFEEISGIKLSDALFAPLKTIAAGKVPTPTNVAITLARTTAERQLNPPPRVIGGTIPFLPGSGSGGGARTASQVLKKGLLNLGEEELKKRVKDELSKEFNPTKRK